MKVAREVVAPRPANALNSSCRRTQSTLPNACSTWWYGSPHGLWLTARVVLRAHLRGWRMRCAHKQDAIDVSTQTAGHRLSPV